MKPLVAIAWALVALAWGSTAAAAPPEGPPEADDTASWENAPATRRSGFTAGVLAGMSFGTVAGYPNEFSKIDNVAYRAATSGVGPAGMIYLGGALTDWFTFGFGFSRSSYGSSRMVTSGSTYLFHIEAFPLFFRGGKLRDIAVFADFGTGTATIQRRSDDGQYSSSGSLSAVGLGAFWETWRLAGHIALGPYASGHYQDSNAMTRYFGEFGVRGAFYGGP